MANINKRVLFLYMKIKRVGINPDEIVICGSVKAGLNDESLVKAREAMLIARSCL